MAYVITNTGFDGCCPNQKLEQKFAESEDVSGLEVRRVTETRCLNCGRKVNAWLEVQQGNIKPKREINPFHKKYY